MSTFSTLGIKLELFDVLIEQWGGRDGLTDATTNDICNLFVKPMTLEAKQSLVELYSSSSNTSSYIGEANWFVSHAWSYKFIDVVDTLHNFFEDKFSAVH